LKRCLDRVFLSWHLQIQHMLHGHCTSVSVINKAKARLIKPFVLLIHSVEGSFIRQPSYIHQRSSPTTIYVIPKILFWIKEDYPQKIKIKMCLIRTCFPFKVIFSNNNDIWSKLRFEPLNWSWNLKVKIWNKQEYTYISSVIE
jgi:hypothetical protein